MAQSGEASGVQRHFPVHQTTPRFARSSADAAAQFLDTQLHIVQSAAGPPTGALLLLAITVIAWRGYSAWQAGHLPLPLMVEPETQQAYRGTNMPDVYDYFLQFTSFSGTAKARQAGADGAWTRPDDFR